MSERVLDLYNLKLCHDTMTFELVTRGHDLLGMATSELEQEFADSDYWPDLDRFHCEYFYASISHPPGKVVVDTVRTCNSLGVTRITGSFLNKPNLPEIEYGCQIKFDSKVRQGFEPGGENIDNIFYVYGHVSVTEALRYVNQSGLAQTPTLEQYVVKVTHRRGEWVANDWDLYTLIGSGTGFDFSEIEVIYNTLRKH